MIAALIMAAPLAAHAQGVVYRDRPHNPRGALGITGVLARPVGEFQQFVAWGGGLGLHGLVNFDRGGHLGLRIDGSFLIYGHERYSTPFPTVPRIWVDVTTDNMIFSLGVGPQITLGSGAVRPYLFGTAGLSYFATISSLDGDYHDLARTTNFDDFAPALTGGGGLLLRLNQGRRPIYLDLSAQSTYHGEVDYLTRGDIVENFDGSVTLFPVRSNANLWTFRMGVTFGL
jgi:hypothetical protein